MIKHGDLLEQRFSGCYNSDRFYMFFCRAGGHDVIRMKTRTLPVSEAELIFAFVLILVSDLCLLLHVTAAGHAVLAEAANAPLFAQHLFSSFPLILIKIFYHLI